MMILLAVCVMSCAVLVDNLRIVLAKLYISFGSFRLLRFPALLLAVDFVLFGLGCWDLYFFLSLSKLRQNGKKIGV